MSGIEEIMQVANVDVIQIKQMSNMICKPIVGRLELIIGPMFASKTTELIRIASKYRSIGKKIIAINHAFNNRYGTVNISSHNHQILENCIIGDSLGIVIEEHSVEIEEADVIIIEELQFFRDAFEKIVELVDIRRKIVIAAGLDGDFRREPFGDIYRLIPHAENIIKLSAFCSICRDGTPAYFTKRFTSESETTLVGTNDHYRAVCRYHYIHNDKRCGSSTPPSGEERVETD
jgi:thymidine kinase